MYPHTFRVNHCKLEASAPKYGSTSARFCGEAPESSGNSGNSGSASVAASLLAVSGASGSPKATGEAPSCKAAQEEG